MVYKLIYSLAAEKDLARIEKSQAIRIIKKVCEYALSGDPFSKAKKLKGFSIDTYRFRVGDYRVIFRQDIRGKMLVVLIILKIAHRKDAYKKM